MEARPVRPKERAEWLRLRRALWPDADPDELSREMEQLLHSRRHSTFVVTRPDGGLAGVLEASLRDVAEGCSTTPVGYVEGWYVDPDVRRRGIGRRLMAVAEAWARSQGCREIASDSILDNVAGHAAHRAIGYVEVERAVHFRKALAERIATLDENAADENLVVTVAAPTDDDLRAIEQGLDRHAIASGIEPGNHAPLAVILRHPERGTVGGLIADTVWGWLQVKQLWIADELRHRSFGRKLLLLAEAEAVRRGCHHALLDTFDFQALPFYEKEGYSVFGRLEDFPRGHVRYFVAKELR